MTDLLHWAYFIVGPFLSAWAAMFVWGKFEILSYALVAGTLTGVIVSLGISMLFWTDAAVCDYCYSEAPE